MVAAASASWLACLLFAATVAGESGVPPHMQFNYEQGVISLASDPRLRFNAKGGPETGSNLVLWPCGPHSHELFNISNGRVTVAQVPQMCLHAAGGPGAGHKIITWPCPKDGEEMDHEEFVFEESTGFIRLKRRPEFCVNVPESKFELGTGLVLYPCGQGASNEVFSFDSGLIKLKANPTLHFNIKGGDVTQSGEVLLWQCQAHSHEMFEFTTEKRLVLTQRPLLCVNAEGGLHAGHRLILWPCSQEGKPVPNEKFAYDGRRKVIIAVDDPTLGFNVKAGETRAGGELILYSLPREEL